MAGNNPKNGAESGEEVPEKILFLENNEVYRDIKKHILKEWRVDIKTDDPDLVLCMTDGPATTDIEYTLGKLNVKQKYIVLLIQTKEIHALKELASLAMDHYNDKNMECVKDLAYTPEASVYKCQINTEAERKLQEAFGIKCGKKKTAPNGNSAKTRSNTPGNDPKNKEESGQEGQNNKKKIRCPEKNKVYADVREHLLQEWRIDIEADDPDLVLCYTDGRLTCDIQYTMEKLNVKSKYIVLLIQTKEKHALKHLASSAMTHYRDDNMDWAIDLGYTPERGVYKCQMNTEAERKLQEAFRIKPDNKKLSSKESTSKGSGNDRKSKSEVITDQPKSEKEPERPTDPRRAMLF